MPSLVAVSVRAVYRPIDTVNRGVPVTGTDVAVSASIRTDERPGDASVPGCETGVVVMNGAAIPRGPSCTPANR